MNETKEKLASRDAWGRVAKRKLDGCVMNK